MSKIKYIHNEGFIFDNNTDINGLFTIDGQLKLMLGTENVGYVLTSDADGNATWQAVSTNLSDAEVLQIVADGFVPNQYITFAYDPNGNGASVPGINVNIEQLTITDVSVFPVYTTLSEFTQAEYSNGNEFQEGDIIVLTDFVYNTGEPDQYTATTLFIHNGGTIGDNSDFTIIETPPLNDTMIRGLFSATAPLMYDNNTGIFSIPAADNNTDGYLTSTDWNTFNNKSDFVIEDIEDIVGDMVTVDGVNKSIQTGISVTYVDNGTGRGYLNFDVTQQNVFTTINVIDDLDGTVVGSPITATTTTSSLTFKEGNGIFFTVSGSVITINSDITGDNLSNTNLTQADEDRTYNTNNRDLSFINIQDYTLSTQTLDNTTLSFNIGITDKKISDRITDSVNGSFLYTDKVYDNLLTLYTYNFGYNDGVNNYGYSQSNRNIVISSGSLTLSSFGTPGDTLSISGFNNFGINSFDLSDAVFVNKSDGSVYTLNITNLYAFKVITVSGQGNVEATTLGDTLSFIAGINTTITTSGNNITFNASNISTDDMTIADGVNRQLLLDGTGSISKFSIVDVSNSNNVMVAYDTINNYINYESDSSFYAFTFLLNPDYRVNIKENSFKTIYGTDNIHAIFETSASQISLTYENDTDNNAFRNIKVSDSGIELLETRSGESAAFSINDNLISMNAITTTSISMLFDSETYSLIAKNSPLLTPTDTPYSSFMLDALSGAIQLISSDSQTIADNTFIVNIDPINGVDFSSTTLNNTAAHFTINGNSNIEIQSSDTDNTTTQTITASQSFTEIITPNSSMKFGFEEESIYTVKINGYNEKQYNLYVETTSTTPTNLNYKTGSPGIPLTANSVNMFTANVVIRDTVSSAIKTIRITGTVKNDGATTSAFVGSPEYIVYSEDGGATAYTLTATTTGGVLNFEALGNASNLVRFLAKVEMVELI